MTDDIPLDAQAVIDAYRQRVTTAVGTAVEPALWDAAIADATTAALRRQVDDLAAASRSDDGDG